MTLPEPDENGVYRYDDGCVILPSVRGTWNAYWADRTPLRDDDYSVSFFKSPEEAAERLAAGGEGRQILTQSEPSCESHVITVQVEGGVIQNICDIPPGVVVVVMDYDTEGFEEEEGDDRLRRDTKGEEYVHSEWCSQKST